MDLLHKHLCRKTQSNQSVECPMVYSLRLMRLHRVRIHNHYHQCVFRHNIMLHSLNKILIRVMLAFNRHHRHSSNTMSLLTRQHQQQLIKFQYQNQRQAKNSHFFNPAMLILLLQVINEYFFSLLSSLYLKIIIL